ncbi:SDR family NAD(P)-dependent oxidoreductase [Rhizohabitans arisaemae]|uniref:SDR family NAD(P)-dependent oxidoreductase n=1 Tax=Rhizohabitans arisaemae TaxID=2720610 RepID=UPI0024B27A62|nr:SDR family oxidoreductase [Rhizohabitans arisaemae]
MNTGLDGRVAVVTGAASGIGAATARALAAEGCRIVAADLREETVTAPAGHTPGTWVAVGADLSTPGGAQRLVQAAEENFGRLDVLVACAGVYETGGVDDVDDVVWDRVHGVNLRGTYLCARAAMKTMARGGYGRIVTFSSIAAQTGGLAAGPAYVAAKAGVLGLTRSLAGAAGPHGITVNCVCPGIIETPMTAAIDEETKRATAARTPMRRNGTPEDVAAVVVMLASTGAGFVTGAHIDVNGGLHMT